MAVTPRRTRIGGGTTKCNTCGTELPTGTNPCPTCGRNPTDPEDTTWTPPATPAYQPNKVVGAIIVIVFLLVVCPVLYFTNVFGYVDLQGALRSQTNNGTPAAQLPSDPTAVLPATAPALELTPSAQPEPTAVRPTASAPNPTVTMTPANQSKGFLLIEYGLVSTSEINGLKSMFPNWSIQTYGSNDKINFYQALVDVAAKYDGRVLIFTTGKDAASPEGYTLDSAVTALQGKDITFLILKKDGDDTSLFASLIADRVGGTAITKTDKNELAQRTLELMK